MSNKRFDDDDFNDFAELSEEEMARAMEEVASAPYFMMDSRRFQPVPMNAPKVFDAASARAIVSSNKAGQLSRELSNIEARIRDAAYDRATQVECGDLAPETVQELRSRGFTVTVRKNTFLDDPRLYYTSESFAAGTYYIVSWKVEELQ